MNGKFQHGERGLVWVAIYILLKGALALAFAVGFLQFLGTDVDHVVGEWLRMNGVDLQNRFVVELLAKLDLLNDHHIKMMSGAAFAFAGIFITQGAGLLAKKCWAEFFTIAMTALLIPVELYESIRHFAIWKIVILILNFAVLWYLVAALLRERKERREGLARVLLN